MDDQQNLGTTGMGQQSGDNSSGGGFFARRGWRGRFGRRGRHNDQQTGQVFGGADGADAVGLGGQLADGTGGGHHGHHHGHHGHGDHHHDQDHDNDQPVVPVAGGDQGIPENPVYGGPVENGQTDGGGSGTSQSGSDDGTVAVGDDTGTGTIPVEDPQLPVDDGTSGSQPPSDGGGSDGTIDGGTIITQPAPDEPVTEPSTPTDGGTIDTTDPNNTQPTTPVDVPTYTSGS